MQKLTDHYQQLLGFPAIWEVDDVNLSISGQKIEVHLRFVGDEVVCPQCGVHGKAYDKAPEQRWRHLDTMQFETVRRESRVCELFFKPAVPSAAPTGTCRMSNRPVGSCRKRTRGKP